MSSRCCINPPVESHLRGDTIIRTKELLYEFLLASNGTALPSVPASVESPFSADLLRLGLQEGDVGSDSEEEEEEEDSLAVKVLSLSTDEDSVRDPDS